MIYEGDSPVDKGENNSVTYQRAAFERCINFMVEMIEKYGGEDIINMHDNSASPNINITAVFDETVA